jgi:CTP:phosphocholine cytidylyltransferase-like protein
MKSKNPHNAIILASEITKGMKSIGSKALLPISSTFSVIDYQIHFLKKFYAPINIYICTGFDHDKIVKKTKKYKDVTYVYNKNYETDNQIGSLLLCLEEHNINNAILLNNGILIGEKIPVGASTEIFTISSSRKLEFNIGCHNTHDTDFLFYDLPQKWIECVYLDQQFIQEILSIHKKNNVTKLFLFEMLNIICEQGRKLKINKLQRSSAMKINSTKDLAQAKRFYEKYICTKTV